MLKHASDLVRRFRKSLGPVTVSYRRYPNEAASASILELHGRAEMRDVRLINTINVDSSIIDLIILVD